MDSGSEPVRLCRVFDAVEAEIIVAKLRSAGITAYVSHNAPPSVYPLSVDGLALQDIFVRAAELEEARAALDVPDGDS